LNGRFAGYGTTSERSDSARTRLEGCAGTGRFAIAANLHGAPALGAFARCAACGIGVSHRALDFVPEAFRLVAETFSPARGAFVATGHAIVATLEALVASLETVITALETLVASLETIIASLETFAGEAITLAGKPFTLARKTIRSGFESITTTLRRA
jgi:hypothetical protein